MADLQPTPERIAAARRAAGREWTFGPEGTVELTTNPVLASLHLSGLIAPQFVSSLAQLNGGSDYYRLTDAGRKWLAENMEG